MAYQFVTVTVNYLADTKILADGSFVFPAGLTLHAYELIYTVPAGKVALLFAGHIVNQDDVNQLTHSVRVASNDHDVLNEVPVPYGSSLNPGKAVFYQNTDISVVSHTLYMDFSLYFLVKDI